MRVSVSMAFKLTYIDGQEDTYDDDTKWEVDDGVLKLGRGDGDWSVLVSPGHWATIELGKSTKDKNDKKDKKDRKDTDDKSDNEDKDKAKKENTDSDDDKDEDDDES
jgi:hypothetical protein